MKRTSNLPQAPNRAKRHFLGVAASAGARIAGIAAFGSLGALGSARADNGNHFGWSQPNNPHSGGGNCFLRGTAIETARGEKLIEDARIGDFVISGNGRTHPIKWIGYRAFRKSGASWPASVLPVLIARGALAEDTPHRDLYLSPGHRLLLDGVLIAAKELVNGVSVTYAMPPEGEKIEYFHIMLDTHEVMLAEGAPAESYLPLRGDYENFSNFMEYQRLYPSEAWPVMIPYAAGTPQRGREHLKALLRLGLPRSLRGHDPVEEAYVSVYRRVAARAEAVFS